MSNINKTFWDNYYKNNKGIIKSSLFANFVYDNYINEYNNKNIYFKIADLGCGNCIDSIFFSEKGNLCYSIDINGVIDKEYPNCNLIKADVEEMLEYNKLQTLVDLVYMRWLLHALPYKNSENIFKNAINNVKPNGLICVEVRSLNDLELIKNSKYDDNDKSYETTHKRWLYTTEMCKKIATENNCEILYCEEGYFSPNINTETDNPLLIRIICKKKLLAYYEQSENYNNYKHILPQMKDHTIKSYNDMDILNKILEKHNIKYVAVAGTTLGLNRHGGIIPWDNDIDIGFIECEWEKLLNFTVLDDLEKNGLKYVTHHACHSFIGSIDCFKLALKNNSYDGDAGTYCHKDEYKNIAKQIFGYTYIYAPLCSKKSLTRRYGNYFCEGDVNDNFHFKDDYVKRFKLNNYDLSYQLK